MAAERTELLDQAGQDVEDVLDFRLGRELAEAESQRILGAMRGESHRFQNM